MLTERVPSPVKVREPVQNHRTQIIHTPASQNSKRLQSITLAHTDEVKHTHRFGGKREGIFIYLFVLFEPNQTER